jgi:hypothetical protein
LGANATAIDRRPAKQMSPREPKFNNDGSGQAARVYGLQDGQLPLCRMMFLAVTV